MSVSVDDPPAGGQSPCALVWGVGGHCFDPGFIYEALAILLCGSSGRVCDSRRFLSLLIIVGRCLSLLGLSEVTKLLVAIRLCRIGAFFVTIYTTERASGG